MFFNYYLNKKYLVNENLENKRRKQNEKKFKKNDRYYGDSVYMFRQVCE